MRFFTAEKIYKQQLELKAVMYREAQEIGQFRFREGDEPGAERPEFDDRDWLDFRVGDSWGGYDITAWFRATLEIPAHWRDGRVYIRLLTGPRDGGDSTAETMLYVNGAPLQGIDIWHEEAWLPPELLRGGRIQVALKAWSGVLGVPARRRFVIAQLLLVDPPAERLYHLSAVLLAAVAELDENDLRRAQLLELLDSCYARLDWSVPRSEAFYASAGEAFGFLRAALDRLEQVQEIKPKVWGIGHAHIDMAWLWRLGHSREKVARTFATALHLMRQYPEYRFMHSSPQLYEYLRQDYPAIFERVKERIAAGQWEITGGMWIESDTNLVSGESLIRQFLHGTRYIREQFGVESRLLWLPDVFGYTWSLPQIARGCGMEYFLTSKISWSQFNRFPYDTFHWRGIDGTELLTHFVTTPEQGSRFYTYNGEFRPTDVKGIWANYREKADNDELLMLFGWGDGGGGPTKEMLESAQALKNLPGLPSVGQQLGETFFAGLAERVADRQLPVWNGELYLEYHRGTYTSQAASKRANRKSEWLLHDAEWLCAMSDALSERSDYPHAALDESWKLLLLNQFHDILPGSSIRQVYEDSALDYARIAELAGAARAEAEVRLAKQIRTTGPSLLALNSLSWARGGLVSLPWSAELAGRAPLLGEDQAGLTQEVEESGERRVLLEVADVPSLGYQAFPLAPARRAAPDDPHSAISVRPDRLENRFFRIEINERGQISRLWDKRARREVLAGGARGNVLQTFTDKPMAFDAWDIDIYYQEQMRELDDLLDATVEESGPLRGVLRLRWRLRDSTITQRLTIYRDDPRIDFRTEAEWHEQQILLKVAFPVNVHSTRATYDIQFGQIERPTHWNTSWDWARFEVCAHKWADLSEGDYGVALLNDCKYGYDIRDNVMRLTLIKSSIRPDALADKGHHVFTYSLLPHAGDWRAGGVAQSAYELNAPATATLLPAQPHGALPERIAFAEVDADYVIVETVKRAEDGDAWVVRVYESQQRRAERVTLRFGRPIRRAQVCNMVEQSGEEVALEDGAIVFAVTPYAITTFKVWL